MLLRNYPGEWSLSGQLHGAQLTSIWIEQIFLNRVTLVLYALVALQQWNGLKCAHCSKSELRPPIFWLIAKGTWMNGLRTDSNVPYLTAHYLSVITQEIQVMYKHPK